MILIVEDNPENAELLKLFLERKAGLECRISTDGEEIMHLCQSGDVRLVVMDIQLHHTFLDGKPMTGIELTQRIKQHPQSSSIPVLLATAHAMNEQREQFLHDSGADGYLVKPIEDYELLIAEIHRCLR